MPSGKLTSEQKQAMELKRQEALKRKHAKSPGKSSLVTVSNVTDKNTAKKTFADYLKANAASSNSGASNSIINYYAKSADNVIPSSGSSIKPQAQTTNKPPAKTTDRQKLGDLQQANLSSHPKAIIQAACSLVSPTRFEVRTSYHEGMIKIFKCMTTANYNAKTRMWTFELAEHDKLIKVKFILPIN